MIGPSLVKSTYVLMLAFLVFIMASGCLENEEREVEEIPQDVYPPVVVATCPSIGAVGVDPNTTEIWVEFKNVRGDKGWLFGDAEWIAFDMPEVCGFVVVDRVDLKDWCRDNIDFSALVDKADAYRRCYSRKDREDLITKLVLGDLQELDSYRVVPYCSTYSHPDGTICYVSDSTIS